MAAGRFPIASTLLRHTLKLAAWTVPSGSASASGPALTADEFAPLRAAAARFALASDAIA